jgi:hypothetical protein
MEHMLVTLSQEPVTLPHRPVTPEQTILGML